MTHTGSASIAAAGLLLSMSHCGAGANGFARKEELVVVPTPPVAGSISSSSSHNGRSPRDDQTHSRGWVLYSNDCAPCHSLDGSRIVGPSLQGVLGREERLADGRRVVIDEVYLRKSILEPQSDVVEGYSPIMPKFSMPDSDIEELIELIRSPR